MRGGPCTKHVSRPQVEAHHACRGRGRPKTKDVHAHKCPRPEAEGRYVHACPRLRAGRGRGGCDRPNSRPN
eukprot:355138-Chlamydomonas_euryale.AAC.2